MVKGVEVRALVDTGCLNTVVSSKIVGNCPGENYMIAFDGSRVKCQGSQQLIINVNGVLVSVNAVVSDSLLSDIGVVLGMDVITFLGGVLVNNGTVEFGLSRCCAVQKETQPSRSTVLKVEKKRRVQSEGGPFAGMEVREVIEDQDFRAVFDGNIWTVEWKWKGNPPTLKNKIGCYDKQMDSKTREGFEEEVERWIQEGILAPWSEHVETGLIPLMAVVQPTKNKIRPVLDFRELNGYVRSRTGDDFTDVCTETLREWRQTSGAATIVDLKGAYLQIRISPDLWKYQLVRYKGKTYCLTRLGFGLTSAPRIMTKILKTVLGKNKDIESATHSYIDDILLDENKVTSAELIEHLSMYGLKTKEPESLNGGAALGLVLKANHSGELMMSRANKIPHPTDRITKRELFSICGKLTGHYPIAGWLRISCSYMKRRASVVGWEDAVDDEVEGMLRDVLVRVGNEDPVKGKWFVPKATRGIVWCDASSIGLGVLLEVNGDVVEDAAWLRKVSDFGHINVAELEAVMKGVNLAIKWGITEIEIMTDSATVAGWVKTVLSEEKRVQTKGASELIVKRRLGILKNLISEFELDVSITLVPTRKNKADVLTRVKKEWLSSSDDGKEEGSEVAVCAAGQYDLKALHEMHHMGVDRSLYVARKVRPETSRDEMKKVVGSCEQCQSIDPAPTVHEVGNLSVSSDWTRLAVDITHHHNVPYISIIDCGPGRFAIWRKLRRETAEFVAEVIDEVMLERGPVSELLMDNGAVFHSDTLSQVLCKWGVKSLFRCAYRPNGNGIVERHHRTVKSIAERGNISPQEAVFWYNFTPRSGIDPTSVPHRAVYQYEWKISAAITEEETHHVQGRFKAGDEVWVKPPNCRCTTKWKRGTVTGANSVNNVLVDGMARHVLDVRRVVHDEIPEVEDEEEEEVGGEQAVNEPQLRGTVDTEERHRRRHPERIRDPPPWMADYEI